MQKRYQRTEKKERSAEELAYLKKRYSILSWPSVTNNGRLVQHFKATRETQWRIYARKDFR